MDIVNLELALLLNIHLAYLQGSKIREILTLAKNEPQFVQAGAIALQYSWRLRIAHICPNLIHQTPVTNLTPQKQRTFHWHLSCLYFILASVNTPIGCGTYGLLRESEEMRGLNFFFVIQLAILASCSPITYQMLKPDPTTYGLRDFIRENIGNSLSNCSSPMTSNSKNFNSAIGFFNCFCHRIKVGFETLNPR
jgi:hypothetical protein